MPSFLSRQLLIIHILSYFHECDECCACKGIVSYCGGSCRLVVLLAQTSARKLRQRCRDEMFVYETDDVEKSYKPPGSLA